MSQANISGRTSQAEDVQVQRLNGSMLSIFHMEEARMNGVVFKKGCRTEDKVKLISRKSGYMES